MAEKFPALPFERYCDDVVVHAMTERQATYVKGEITKRLAQYGLELHPDKTKIVYCKDSNRPGNSELIRFDFCGYTFRPREAKSAKGVFTGFLPAVGTQPLKDIRSDMAARRIGRRSDRSLSDIAAMINPIVRGWTNFYGRYYPSVLVNVLYRINEMLVRWARRKFKRLRTSNKRAWSWLVKVARREPELFAHWQFGARPGSWATRAG